MGYIDNDEGVIKINFYITSKCKLKCKYCTLYDNNLQHPTFDTKAWDYLLDNVGTSEIHIYGGEPFENPEIYDILEYFNSKKSIIKTNVLTNGINIDIDRLNKLNISLLLSYHPIRKFKDFIKDCNKIKHLVTRVSYMYEGDNGPHDKKRINEYKLLTRLYDFGTIFCPVLYFGKNNSPSLSNLKKHPEFLASLFKDRNYHFTEAFENQTTFDLQNKYGMFATLKDGEVRYCQISNYMLEIYNNKIYRCASELHYNIGTHDESGGTSLYEFEKIKDLTKTSYKCEMKNCAVFDHKYLLPSDKKPKGKNDN
jgi:sulfatase maturation enzyme AslB (radical SAM superfamily)